MKLKLINEKKRCKECAFRFGHRHNCSKAQNCKHTLVGSESKHWPVDVVIFQCIKCFSIYTLVIASNSNLHDDEEYKKFKAKGYKFI